MSLNEANVSDRRRRLPPWMKKKEEEEKIVKDKEPLRSRRRRKVTRAALYCMNEKELVEAAVSYLTNCACAEVALPAEQKVEDKDKPGDTTVKIREKSSSSKPVTEALEELSSDCSDAQEMTYVSETDENVELEAEKREERSQTPSNAVEDDDDALRLVREIFFT